MRTRNFVVGFLVACFMAVFSMSLWGAAIEIYDPDEQENKVVTSDYPLPVIHDALDDATDTNTGIFIKPATGATFDISGIVISDATLTDTSINDGWGILDFYDNRKSGIRGNYVRDKNRRKKFRAF